MSDQRDDEPELCESCGHPVDVHDLRGWGGGAHCSTDCETCVALARAYDDARRDLP